MSALDHRDALNGIRPDSGPPAVLEVTDLVKTYPARGSSWRRRESPGLRAVDGVSLTIGQGETLALVGESGSGKSTVGRCLLRLIEPTSGTVRFLGEEVTGLSRRQLRPLRAQMQIVFQDPYSAIDPRMTIDGFLAEPLHVHRWDHADIRPRVAELLDTVGLDQSLGGRYPHELSGGQRQRVVIARALALRPTLLVLDEPVAALDVSIQAGVMRLLAELQQEQGLSYLFIAHDLAVVRQLSHRVAVMYRGRIVETGTAADVYSSPRHPYTRALLSAAPVPDPVIERRRRRIVLAGDPSDAAAPVQGCRFRVRCWKAQERCASQDPALVQRDTTVRVACHFPEADPAPTPAPSPAPTPAPTNEEPRP